MHRKHDRLGHRFAPHPERIVGTRSGEDLRATLGDERPNLGQVQAGREVVAVGIQHAHPDLRVVAEPRVGRRELIDHGQVEGVALGRPREADAQDGAVTLDRDALGVGPPAHRATPAQPWQELA